MSLRTIGAIAPPILLALALACTEVEVAQEPTPTPAAEEIACDYPHWTRGCVQTALADITGDGVLETIVSDGFGAVGAGPPLIGTFVRVYQGQRLIFQEQFDLGNVYLCHPNRGDLRFGAPTCPDGQIFVADHVYRWDGQFFVLVPR